MGLTEGDLGVLEGLGLVSGGLLLLLLRRRPRHERQQREESEGQRREERLSTGSGGERHDFGDFRSAAGLMGLLFNVRRSRRLVRRENPRMMTMCLAIAEVARRNLRKRQTEPTFT